ncbi:hypothetical protein KY290_008999 [Solanum tuberosum]|uniref:Uncharacterized protein n=1 Tax=Solanum tuberosum TaxID=4113 RepID=A0ABQ7WA71_SOLTU|nr:hypothetical protein KY284_025239 [Solanum tuberosum]KAH0691178.1 hypothetical protein KY289_018536 [Solanum tuberosum]KAH0695679.1 hypothetical protein KY289_013161 [Solanum tuberosum]KAH0735319.1 hypothetical protein KY285_011026 [Solanum tuberosum]KAH0735324.1 hypothetical protein KY285_011031 [Solanum tuberosum]
MVHGILQFTPSIAFRYVLHRCESRDIRCRESFVFKEQRASPRTIRERGARGGLPILVFLGAFRAGVRWPPKRARKRASRRGREGASAPKCLKRVRGSFCFAGFDNDPSAGSMDFSRRRGQRTAHVAAIRTFHRIIQSVGATGGVYKGQGRSQRELMTRAY